MKHFRIIRLFFVLCALNNLSLRAQPAACVHGGGVRFLLDAYLGALGACNCEKATVFLHDFPKCNTNAYVLEFEDNFEGNTLDTSRWEIQPWGQGALENSATLEHNSLNNVILSDGICRIVAKKETVERKAVSWKNDSEILQDGITNLRRYEYTSSNLWTKKKFLHGKYEIKCRMPKGNGFWPAFWMFGGSRWNEIDVFDSYAGTHELVTSIGHDYDNTSTSNGCSKAFSGFDLSEWHTYTCIFDDQEISFLVDGRLVRVISHFLTITGKPLACGDYIEQGSYFQLKSYPIEPMSIIVNLALTKNRGGKGGFIPVDNSTPFPSSLDIDYIRYWQRGQEPERITVFPNPGDQLVYVASNTDILSVSLFNIQGALVYRTSNITSGDALDLSGQVSGLYFLVAELPGSIKTAKVLKLR